MEKYVLYKVKTVFIVYFNGVLVLDTSGKNLDKFVQEHKDAKFDVEDQGDPSDYVGIVELTRVASTYIEAKFT